MIFLTLRASPIALIFCVMFIIFFFCFLIVSHPLPQNVNLTLHEWVFLSSLDLQLPADSAVHGQTSP